MKTKISVDSKLMENQKQAEVMAAGKMFQALQTSEGHALFFSIGTDSHFYLVREIPGDIAGWRKTNLGSSIGNHKVKHFVVSQNHETNLVDIVIAVEIDGNDHIYTALNLVNDHTTWEKAVLFAEIPYDNKQVSFSKFVVSGLFTAETSGSSFTMVDLIQDPDSQNQFFYRFILDPFRNAGKNAWIRKPLGSNLTATKSVISCVGRMEREERDGVYTFGSVNDKEQLLYTPLFNDYAEEGSELQAEPIRLEMPHKASAIAVSEIENNLTNLYVSAEGKLYLFKSDLQDGDKGTVVLEHPLLKDVLQLHINTNSSRVYVWGLNRQGQIFYTSCQRNKETVKDAWSVPVPILRNVTQIATYLNKNHAGNVIFAHNDGKLIQLTQDPVTTLWNNRNIVLPTTDMMSVLKFNTFTTHISLTDETNKAVANASIEISSVSPVSVYVNNQFEILSAENPLEVRTDITGNITILQQTDTIAGVCYNLKTKGTREKIIVNPMIAMLEKMAEVKNGSDLGNVQITDENGNQKPLVGSDIDKKTKDEVAQSMSRFIETAANMPQDGSVKKIPQTKRMLKNFKASNFKATKDNFWGLTFSEDNKVEFYEGPKAMLKFGAIHSERSDVLLFRSADNQLHNIFDDIASTIGDIFNFIREGVSSLLSMTVMVVEGVYHFIIDIANKVYRCVLDSVNAVISAIELVYNKIAVFFEDLVKWIGFLFQWKDILATKNVMKNVYLLQIDTAISALSGGKAAIHSSFGDLKNMISKWADLPVIASTPDATSASANPGGMNSSEANYGIYQLNSNKDAMVVKENAMYAKPVYEELFDNFMEFLYAQGDTFSGAYNAIKTEIIDKFGSLSVTDIIKKFVAIIADTLLGAVEHLLVLVVDILIALAQTVKWLLTAEVDIPVISWLYEKISDSKLTLLDLICLVSAIPATIVHKAINSAAPFPNGEAFTNSLINAKAEAEIKEIFKNNKTVARNYMIVSGYYATIGSVVMIICDALKESFDVMKVKHPAWLGQLTGAAYCCYQSPKRAKRLMTGANPDTFQKLDGMLTDMFMLRAAFDTPKVGEKGYTIAKWFDFALHLVWNVPVIANIAHNHGEATGKYKALIPESIADFAFNLAGIMAPIPDMVKNPEAKAAAYGVKYGMMLTYGIVSPVAAHLKAE